MTNLEACLKKFWKRLDEWVMIFWLSTGRHMCDVEPQGLSIHTLQRVYRRDSADHGFHHPSSQHKATGVVSCVTSSSWVASYPESFNDKGQEVIISYNTYPTSASTSTTWLGAKCGCTYPPERGHLSVNIHCRPLNRSSNY